MNNDLNLYKASKAYTRLAVLIASLLISQNGYAELQTVDESGITVIKAYKVPRGEPNVEGETESKSSNTEYDQSDTIIIVPDPKCSSPQNENEVPFPGPTVILDNISIPIRGKAKWLAPDPGIAGKSTIEGIDSDDDCVRDDIEYFIAQKYPSMNQAKARTYLFHYAKYLGLFLRADLTREYAVYYSDRMYIATTCARKELGDTPTTSKGLDMIFGSSLFHVGNR